MLSNESRETDPVLDPVPEHRPGRELATAREGAGIGLRSMADTLHLPENQLTALENDDYANLPPPTFVRGYLRSYARAVGLDDDEIVAMYDAQGSAAEDPKLRLSGARDPSANNHGLLLALLALALVVAVSLGAWWWQSGNEVTGGAAVGAQDSQAEATGAADSGRDESAAGARSAPGDPSTSRDASVSGAALSEPESSSASPAEESDATTATATDPADATSDATTDAVTDAVAGAEGTPEDADPSASATLGLVAESGGAAGTDGADGAADDPGETVAADAAAEPAADTSADAGADGESDATAADAAAETAAADAGEEADTESYQRPIETASAAAASAPAAAEGPESLYLHVDGRSWIEVYDARGRELVYTLYTGAEPLRLNGWAPFDVFLGNSPDVSVEFNGSGIDKAAFTRSDRTARFLVGAEGASRR